MKIIVPDVASIVGILDVIANGTKHLLASDHMSSIQNLYKTGSKHCTELYLTPDIPGKGSVFQLSSPLIYVYYYSVKWRKRQFGIDSAKFVSGNERVKAFQRFELFVVRSGPYLQNKWDLQKRGSMCPYAQSPLTSNCRQTILLTHLGAFLQAVLAANTSS